MKTQIRQRQFALQYQDSCISFCKYTVDLKKGTVKIHGCWMAASYVDKTVTIEEARKDWKDKLKDGFHPIDYQNAPRDWWFRD